MLMLGAENKLCEKKHLELTTVSLFGKRLSISNCINLCPVLHWNLN